MGFFNALFYLSFQAGLGRPRASGFGYVKEGQLLRLFNSDDPEFQPALQQEPSRTQNGQELLKVGSASKGVGISIPREGGNSPLFVSKLFKTRVTLETQLFIKCGQVSITAGSSILAQICCGLSAG